MDTDGPIVQLTSTYKRRPSRSWAAIGSTLPYVVEGLRRVVMVEQPIVVPAPLALAAHDLSRRPTQALSGSTLALPPTGNVSRRDRSPR